jgi:hypothetical protein
MVDTAYILVVVAVQPVMMGVAAIVVTEFFI